MVCLTIISIFSLSFYLENNILAKNSFKSAAIISILWVLAALIFNIIMWHYLKNNFDLQLANQKSLEFFTGYLLEKSLSLDNIFVFVLIFRYFSIPRSYQRRVLHYGIMGAIVLRLLMIFFGVWLINKIHWILYVFGAFLIFSGGKILFTQHQHNIKELKNNLLIIWCHKYLRTTKKLFQENFFVIRRKKLYITPLFLALILIEASDVVFAVDSIPAILAIVRDPFIIFTSNIFAILGLRALYFFLALGIHKFTFLQPAIAMILIFIGIKMVFEIKLPILVTLGIMAAIMTVSGILSFLKNKK
jgi:tellurite resistance protein TerC